MSSNPNGSISYRPWIGVDLDGTLAHYDTWKAWNIIGKPIPLMVDRIRKWLSEGKEVRIFTARVAFDKDICKITSQPFSRFDVAQVIQNWLQDECQLPRLHITHEKDFQMTELWDDRCIQVIPNTGRTLADEHEAEKTALIGKP